jgi:glyoxylase-like metal-dependent hydrolase (beta-lactamase superfamily II)
MDGHELWIGVRRPTIMNVAMSVDEVATSVYRIVEDDGEKLLCQYLLRGDDCSLLIDAGVRATPRRTLLPAIASIGASIDEVTQLLVTHADVDHCGGLGGLQTMSSHFEAICGPADRAQIEDVEVMIRDRYRRMLHEHGVDETPEFLEWVRGNACMGTIRREMTEGLLTLGVDWDVEVLSVPGHTPGHLALYDPRHRSLVIGDAVMGGASPRSDGSHDFPPIYVDADAYLSTIRRLRAFNADVLLTAHFPVMKGSEVDDFWRASESFHAELDRMVLLHLTSLPATVVGLVAAIAPEIRTWATSADLSLASAILAHLESLQRRGLAECTGGRPLGWLGAS